MEPEDKFIEELILNGSLEFSGIDQDSGEIMYTFTNKLKDFSRDLQNEVNLYFSQEMMQLWEYGFIDMDVTDNNPIVSLTEKAFDNEEVQKLKTNNKMTLKEVLRVLKKER
jgi:hypothetical protein